MGQIASVLGMDRLFRLQETVEDVSSLESAETARLIPGSQRSAADRRRKPAQSILSEGAWGAAVQNSVAIRSAVAAVLPDALKRFAPAMLGAAVLDLALIFLFYLAEGVHGALLFTPATLFFYLAVFFLVAVQEGVYTAPGSVKRERLVVAKSVVWTTLLALLALSSGHEHDSVPLLLWSSLNAFVLCAWRWAWHGLQPDSAVGTRANVLIVGSGAHGLALAEALSHEANGIGAIEFLAEHHFRNGEGPAMLQRLARERCIDQLIIATQDSKAAEAAIKQARRNQLDVLIAPTLFGGVAREVKNVSGMPLVKLHEQQLPMWGLALKRIADTTLAAAGLVALLPLLPLVAASIKLDSPGPVFYCALRIGRKGRRFLCYKFRTMVEEADAAKDQLRSRNQRDGAFFKIANDPRITRVGRFFRRYSLDELPQLWNVLVGDMSLVGPRPHPADDVGRYSIADLRRLDFVPGITGLWQVTARRDPSFQRCVALDVDYINRWNLALDLRILWKTLAAVFRGSGA